MVLSANKKTIESEAPYSVEERDLGELKTGKGVRIGDNMAQVRMLLGPPTKKGRVDKWHMDVMRYIHEPNPKALVNDDYLGIGFRYEAVYYFVHGSLVTIKIYKDLIGGP